MILNHLLKQLNIPLLDLPCGEKEISVLSDSSTDMKSQGVFVAMQGEKVHGRMFIPKAVEAGCMAIVVDSTLRDLPDGYVIPAKIALIVVFQPKEFLYNALPILLNYPAKHINITAITGTNGKTTFTYLMEAIFKQAGIATGVIGTVNYRIGSKVLPAKNTTPGFTSLQYLLAQMRDEHIADCVMEASSHALSQNRLSGLNIQTAVFSNLTQDHLDYHQDMESYFQAKAQLFTPLSNEQNAVINADDVYGRRLMTMTKAKIITYSIDYPSDVRGQIIKMDAKGTRLTIRYPQGQATLTVRFIGRHNVYNVLAAFASGLARGIDGGIIAAAFEQIAFVPGRLEAVDAGQSFGVFIDYAHTPDGLINVLNALRGITQGKIITVFGCGGDRDKTKRPLMGIAVNQLSDWAIITSDNPRSEDPQSIINDIIAGFADKNFMSIVDRREAIRHALDIAKAGDVVLLAGKGHEDYQVLKNKTIAFNERQIINEILCSPSMK